MRREEASALVGLAVLVISGDAHRADLMAAELREVGYDVNVAGSQIAGFVLARELNPVLVISDLVLPDGSGMDVIVRLSRMGISVMVVEEKWDVESLVSLLDLGAVDYLAGPIDMRELLARVAAKFRKRFSRLESGVLTVGKLTLDVNGYLLLVGYKGVFLTPVEQKLLMILMQQPGRLFLYRELMDRVWGPGAVNRATLTMHVSSIRRKLQAENAHGHLTTVRGFGHVLRKPV